MNSTAADADDEDKSSSQDEQQMLIVEPEERKLGISSEVQTELTSQQTMSTQQELNSAYEKMFVGG